MHPMKIRPALRRLVLITLALSGCGDDAPRTVTVVVDSNYGARLSQVEAELLGPGGEIRTAYGFQADQYAWPLSFGAMTDDGETQISVRLVAWGPQGTLSERLATAALAEDGEQAIAVFLDSACEGIACAAGDTCTENGCAPSTVPVLSLSAGQEFDTLCPPHESWCEGDVAMQCHTFGRAPSATTCSDGCGDGTCGGPVVGAHEVTVTVNVGAGGQVVSAPSGLECGAASTCAAPFPSNETVKLTALPAQGSLIDHWSGDCADDDRPGECTVTARQGATASVQFRSDGNGPSDDERELTVTLTGASPARVHSTPDGIDCEGPGECTAWFPEGYRIQLFFTANAPVEFRGWGGDCANQSMCSVVMDHDRQVTADFGRR